MIFDKLYAECFKYSGKYKASNMCKMSKSVLMVLSPRRQPRGFEIKLVKKNCVQTKRYYYIHFERLKRK